MNVTEKIINSMCSRRTLPNGMCDDYDLDVTPLTCTLITLYSHLYRIFNLANIKSMTLV